MTKPKQTRVVNSREHPIFDWIVDKADRILPLRHLSLSASGDWEELSDGYFWPEQLYFMIRQLEKSKKFYFIEENDKGKIRILTRWQRPSAIQPINSTTPTS